MLSLSFLPFEMLFWVGETPVDFDNGDMRKMRSMTDVLRVCLVELKMAGP